MADLIELELRTTAYSDLTEPDLQRSLIRKCPRLEVANFDGCKTITSDDVIAMANGWPNLRKINLRNCAQVKTTSVCVLLSTNSGLEQIDIGGTNFGSERFVEVEDENGELDYREETRPTLSEVLLLLSQRHGHSLKSLSLNGIAGGDVEVPSLINLITSCPHLEAFSMGNHFHLSEQAIAHFQHLINLRHFQISCGNEDFGMKQLLSLPNFGLLNCLSIDNYSGDEIVPTIASECPLLECFHIGYIRQRSTIISIVENLELIKLIRTLGFSVMSTAKSFRNIEILKLHNVYCPSEEMLDVFSTVPSTNLQNLMYLELGFGSKREWEHSNLNPIEDLLSRRRWLFVFIWRKGYKEDHTITPRSCRQNVNGVVEEVTNEYRHGFLRRFSLSCCSYRYWD